MSLLMRPMAPELHVPLVNRKRERMTKHTTKLESRNLEIWWAGLIFPNICPVPSSKAKTPALPWPTARACFAF
jgi:hypothetical protein